MLPILYTSSDQGAPTLNNALGSLISVIDACGVTGFNNVGISSVSIASNVATVTTAAGHGLQVGHRVTIAGAGTSATNGDKTVLSTPTSTTFTVAVTAANGSESPASASVKRTPLGWVKAFSGTNKAIYKSGDLAANGPMLRVNDSIGTYAAEVFGVEAATGVDAFTDRFPSTSQASSGPFWMKGANTTRAKGWAIVGDERFFFLVTEWTSYTDSMTVSNYGWWVGSFGDLIALKSGDMYATLLTANLGNDTTTLASPHAVQSGFTASSGLSAFFARMYNGVTKSQRAHFAGIASGTGTSGDLGLNTWPVYPSPVDNGLIFIDPSLALDTFTGTNANPHVIRAFIPGQVTPLARHSDLPSTQAGPTIMDTNDGSGTKIAVWTNVSASSVTSKGAFAVKLSAWR